MGRRLRSAAAVVDEAPTTEVAAEWVPIERLKPWDQNPRKNDGVPVEKVAARIKRLGFAAPIVARPDGTVIAGHTRLKAAQKLGLERVPVRFMELNDEEARLLSLADNRLGELADWDTQMLQGLIEDMSPQDLGVAGWADVDTIIEEIEGFDPMGEWDGMPEFDQQDKTAFRTIRVHMKDQAAVDAFAKTVKHNITDATRYLWFPEIEIERLVDKRYTVDES